jgi:hypothetical protein
MRDWILGLAPGFWQWLRNASQSQATSLGTLTGSSIGLIALLIGALFNAHLNRRRDDRLQREDQRAVAAALKAELALWSERLGGVVQSVKDGRAKGSGEWVVPVFKSRLLDDLVPKLGLLRPATITNVIDAYNSVDELMWALLAEGAEIKSYTDDPGHRQILISYDETSFVPRHIDPTMSRIKSAIGELDHY